MNPEGRARCGGEGCSGAVATANSVLRKARDSEQEIVHAMKEVEKLSKMVGVSPAAPCSLQVNCAGFSHLSFVLRCQKQSYRRTRPG